jgi:hypothetical protein
MSIPSGVPNMDTMTLLKPLSRERLKRIATEKQAMKYLRCSMNDVKKIYKNVMDTACIRSTRYAFYLLMFSEYSFDLKQLRKINILDAVLSANDRKYIEELIKQCKFSFPGCDVYLSESELWGNPKHNNLQPAIIIEWT